MPRGVLVALSTFSVAVVIEPFQWTANASDIDGPIMSEAPPADSRNCLRIGVTGHRLNKLGAGELARLRHEVDAVLVRLQRPPAQQHPELPTSVGVPSPLCVVSSLADGADQLVAAAALAAGIELVAPIPFARDVYARDFVGESRVSYYALLDRATEVIELDGPYDSETARRAAYEAVGAEMIERSDIVLAIWDGEEASGRGGTANVVALARRKQRPVLWLPTNSPAERAPRLLLPDCVVETDAVEVLAQTVHRIVAQHGRS